MDRVSLILTVLTIVSVLIITPILVQADPAPSGTYTTGNMPHVIFPPVNPQQTASRTNGHESQRHPTPSPMTTASTGPGFINPSVNSKTRFLSFERVPPSDRQRADPGMQVYQLSGSDQVRVELYKGEQPATGYDLQILHVSQDGNTITVHAIFKQPGPSAQTHPVTTYPADAVEFTVPNGTYTIHVRTTVFEHDTEKFTNQQ